MSRTGQSIESVAKFIEANGSAPGALDAALALELVTDRLLEVLSENRRRARAEFPPLLGGWF